MNLTLLRNKFYGECTHGALFVDGARYCDTFEPLRDAIARAYAEHRDIFIEIKSGEVPPVN